jgi:hypothetical protein
MATDFDLGHELHADMTVYHAKTRSGDHWTEFPDAGIEITLQKGSKPGKILVSIRRTSLIPKDEE